MPQPLSLVHYAMTDPIIPATARNGEYSFGLSGMHEYKRATKRALPSELALMPSEPPPALNYLSGADPAGGSRQS